MDEASLVYEAIRKALPEEVQIGVYYTDELPGAFSLWVDNTLIIWVGKYTNSEKFYVREEFSKEHEQYTSSILKILNGLGLQSYRSSDS